MEQEIIDFKRERDFGEVFGASFTFIRSEVKNLATAMLYYVMPFLVISAILSVFVGMEQQKMLTGLQSSGDLNNFNPLGNVLQMLNFVGLYAICYSIAITSMKCTIYGYIRLYIEKGSGNFGLQEIWAEVKKFFFPVLGGSIIISIIVAIGIVFCFVPGIYFAIALSMTYIAMVFEDKGFGNAFSRSMYLVKNEWWPTFAIIIVAYLIVYSVSTMLSVPTMIMGMKSIFTNLKNIEEAKNITFSTSFIIINSIISVITYVFMVIPMIVISVQYFSLVEKKDKTSLFQRVNDIGN